MLPCKEKQSWGEVISFELVTSECQSLPGVSPQANFEARTYIPKAFKGNQHIHR